ncbi:MAG: tryptophan--tRNA ligase [Nannocystaceae bacterium]|nr:tryptophan--tRNA ligase [bacterium]
MTDLPPRLVSGIQPSGELHLGNYFGAIAQFVKLQEEYAGNCFVFIADYHALTTVRDADTLRTAVFDVAATYLSLGLDPEKVTLFRQSDVNEHVELSWLLATVTGTGLLERAHSYKDKVAKGIRPSVGLFYYPVLMAADILIYDASVVPVGKDQVQHIEMAQDMATHFNEAFGGGQNTLRRPEYQLSPVAKVPGLDGEKMSKSYDNTIPIFLSGKKLKKRVAQVVTDSKSLGDPLDPDTCNVFALLKLFVHGDELEQLEGWYRSGARDGQPFGYGHAKQILAAKIDAHFADARAKYEAHQADRSQVEAVLQAGAERARTVARATMDRVRKASGLR